MFTHPGCRVSAGRMVLVPPTTPASPATTSIHHVDVQYATYAMADAPGHPAVGAAVEVPRAPSIRGWRVALPSWWRVRGVQRGVHSVHTSIRTRALPVFLLILMLMVVLSGTVHSPGATTGATSLQSHQVGASQVTVAASGSSLGVGDGGQTSGQAGATGQGAVVPYGAATTQDSTAPQVTTTLPSCPWSISVGPWSPISLDPCKMAIQILLSVITWGAQMFANAAVALLSPVVAGFSPPGQQATAQNTGPGAGSVLTTAAMESSSRVDTTAVSFGDDPTSCADAHTINILASTPHGLTDCNSLVQLLFLRVEYVAWAALALIILVGGFNLMIRPHLGIPYHEFVEFLPRVLLGALGIVLSLWFARVLISFCNAFDQVGDSALQYQLFTNMPNLVQNPTAEGFLIEFFMIATLILLVLIVLQMLVRLALLDLCIILAPLGMACWILPQTQRWGSLWSGALVSTLLVQPVQVLALALAGHVMTGFPGASGSPGVLQFAIGCAAFYVVWRLPRFMDSWATRMGVGMVGWRDLGMSLATDVVKDVTRTAARIA